MCYPKCQTRQIDHSLKYIKQLLQQLLTTTAVFGYKYNRKQLLANSLVEALEAQKSVRIPELFSWIKI